MQLFVVPWWDLFEVYIIKVIYVYLMRNKIQFIPVIQEINFILLLKKLCNDLLGTFRCRRHADDYRLLFRILYQQILVTLS